MYHAPVCYASSEAYTRTIRYYWGILSIRLIPTRIWEREIDISVLEQNHPITYEASSDGFTVIVLGSHSSNYDDRNGCYPKEEMLIKHITSKKSNRRTAPIIYWDVTPFESERKPLTFSQDTSYSAPKFQANLAVPFLMALHMNVIPESRKRDRNLSNRSPSLKLQTEREVSKLTRLSIFQDQTS